MRWPLAFAVLLGVAVPSFGQEPALPSRDLRQEAVFSVEGLEPQDFDLVDFRAEEYAPPPKSDPKHSIFVIKRHFGASAGWDNNILHASAGVYITMVEWGRWNFGAPTVEFGVGRYPEYNQKTGAATTSSQWTMLVSLASMHYRIGYVSAIGYHCYLNLEQIIDMHSNLTGSQFGLTFSRK